MKKRILSPYSMMYLVTPAIYEKLLLCIDEGDKKLLDSLNKPRDDTQDRRPAQVVIDALSHQEIKQPHSFHDESSLPFHSFDQTSMNQTQADVAGPVVVQQNPPIVVQQPPQQPVPVAVTVLPQVDNPIPQSGGPIAVADTSGDPPAIVVTSVPGPPPPPPPPPAISAIYPPKPVHMSVPTNITRPAVFTQPIRQPVVLNQPRRRTSSPIFDTAPLPEDYEDWDDLEPIRQPKRRVNDSFIDPTGKRLRVNEFDGDAFHVRDDRYRQRMLERARNRRLQSQPPIFTNNPLPRDPVQWQPLQCVPTTTGGQICNPDPVQPPVIVTTKKRSRSESPGHEPPPQRLRMSRSGPSICPICGVKLGDDGLLKMHIRLKHQIKHQVKKEKKKRFTTPGVEPEPEPFVYKPSEDVKFRIKRRFADSGSEPSAQPFVYDPALDTPFRRPKPKKAAKPGPTRHPIKKPNQYRCPICNATLSNLGLFKDHIASKHNRNPDEVIRDMASNMLANPQPGGSRDFYNWTNLRLQPPRPTERRRRFGQLNKSTQEFDKWK